ncbi:hypothetical protein HCN44_007198 [Aphidius gifuensis]|uniref:MADF domain-containing protein n=1 Tax=Aphidius gifuensis TaxID=684658 RepID=A0A834XKI0_APHGI|nr:hypothetical protein HCN44_007198 [Aphidius gifuensis]
MSFTQNEDELLLKAVQEQPALYNLANKNYKDTIYKDHVEAVKARWKSLRDTYNKRRERLGTGSPRCPKKPWSLEAHLAFLETVENERKSTSNVTADTDDVKDIVKIKCEDIDDNEDGYDNINDEDNIDELIGGDGKKDDRHLSTSSVASAGSTYSRKSKPDDLVAEEKVKLYRSLQADISKEENSLDLFFKSLCVQVKELLSHLVPDIRIKMIQIICEIEKSYKFDPCEQPQQHQHLSSAPYLQSQRVKLPLMFFSSTSTDCSAECVTYTIV